MLKKRVITAVCLLPPLVVAVWFDKPLPWLTIFVTIWGLLAAMEFYSVVAASNQKVEPLTSFGLIWTLLFILSPHLDHGYLNPLLLTSAIVLPPVWLLLREQKEGAFLSWVWTTAGILYIGWLLSHFVALREMEFGRDWVLFALFTTFAYDTGAYFIGRALGRHRLAPSISPGKSWEGTIGGLITAIGISLLLVWLLDLPLDYGQTILLAMLVGVFGQIGDLFESMFKRNMGVKDSGKSMPGHGGFLDRMDSVVFAVVVVYYYVMLVVN